MKFTIPVQTIIEPITKVASICTKSPSNPDDLTQFILFEVTNENLTLIGTDNTVQLKAVIPLPEGSCDGTGSFMLKANRANDFFKSLGVEDDISIDLDNDNEVLNITSAGASYTLRIRKAPQDNSFPIFAIQDDNNVKHIVIEEKKLRYMLEKSVFCVSREHFRDYLKGVRFEVKDDELTIFALDGHRMAALNTQLNDSASEPIEFLMTLSGVNELQKLLRNAQDQSLTIAVTEDYISTSTGIYTLSNHLLKCSYPNVRSVLPTDFSSEISVPVQLLSTYVKRVSIFSNKRLNAINLNFSCNKLALHSQNSEHEVATAELDINYPETDKNMEVNLNADFLKDFLNAIDTPNVVFGFAPPYNNTLLSPNEEYNELGVKVRYVVSHIMV